MKIITNKDYERHKEAMDDVYFSDSYNLLTKKQGECNNKNNRVYYDQFCGAPMAKIDKLEDFLKLNFNTQGSMRFHGFVDGSCGDAKINYPVFAHFTNSDPTLIAVLDSISAENHKIPILREDLARNILSYKKYHGGDVRKIKFDSEKLKEKENLAVYCYLYGCEDGKNNIEEPSRNTKIYEYNFKTIENFIECVMKYSNIISVPEFWQLENKLINSFCDLGKILSESDESNSPTILKHFDVMRK